jgi:hypothetical protein
VVVAVIPFLEYREQNITRVLEEKHVGAGWAYQNLNKKQDVMVSKIFSMF